MRQDVSRPERSTGISEEIAQQLRALGARIAPAETAALYAPLHAGASYDGVAVSRNVAYGTHERNVLDVFTTPESDSGRPVVVFIHGGGFSRGDKHAPDSPFYDDGMLWAVFEGLVGVEALAHL